MDETTLRLDAAAARQLVLVRAVEEADPQGRIVGAPERDRIEQEALQASRTDPSSMRLDAARYLQERAARMLAIVETRQPGVAALREPDAWMAWLGWGLPLAAVLFGAALDRIDNPRQVNMLSPPLLAVLLWNVVVYVVLLVSPLVPRRWIERGPWARWQPGVAQLRDRLVREGNVRSQVTARFRGLWWQLTAHGQSQRWRQVLHATAAGWAVGLAISIVLGGLVREYRVGWESTLLDLPQVHAFLSALFGPVVMLLPFEAFSAAELQRMHFASGAQVGVQEARHWVWMYLALLALVVVLPRLLLAAYASWRSRLAMRAVSIDLRGPYFADLLARVSPVRVVLGVTGADQHARAALLRMLRQVCDQPAMQASASQPMWTVLTTPREDELRVMEFDGGSPAGRGEPDLLLVAAGAGEGRQGDAATLVLTQEATCNWTRDAALCEAIAAKLPARKAAGFARICAAWAERNEARFAEAMRVLAAQLLQAARDAEEVNASPLSLRQLVMPSEREAGQQARHAAMQALLERLQAAESQAMAQLLRLHHVDEPVADVLRVHSAGDDKFLVQQNVDSPQAGMAGAATGAAMGAGIDLMTGGLTLGAAAALGALVGGAAAYTAAHWKNRATPAGASQIQLSDDMLQTLAEAAVLRYLAVIHWGRGPAADNLPLRAQWRSEVVAAVEAQRAELAALWLSAREPAEDAHELLSRTARVFADLVRRLLERLPCA